MPARSPRSSRSSGGGDGSSTRSYSEDQVHAFSGKNNDNRSMNNREGSAKPTKSGMASFQASGRFLASYDHHREALDASSTSRRHRGGDTYGTNHSRVDDARKLEEGMRGHSQAKEGSKRPLSANGIGNKASNGHRHRDVGFLATLRTMLFGAREPVSDLSIETLEELHMVTGFTYKELRLTRSHFLALVNEASFITREEFLEIPSVANNPLRERLLVCFGFDSMDNLKFKEFVEILSIFNNPSAQRDQKLRMAFTLVDIDGDGQVSKNDLVRYLELITAAPEGVKIDLNAVAARVIEEGASAPGVTSLSLADFIKIMGAADFADKLTIPL
ncbi:unnamed protein product [Ectocarpus fasciculatus]